MVIQLTNDCFFHLNSTRVYRFTLQQSNLARLDYRMAAKGVLVETNSWHKKVKPDVSRRKDAYEIFKKIGVYNCIIYTLQYIYI